MSLKRQTLLSSRRCWSCSVAEGGHEGRLLALHLSDAEVKRAIVEEENRMLVALCDHSCDRVH